ncbi:MAG: hypothetical protein HND56_00055 [Pseudomonadota bacterium]|nr:hypothetical protein [Pseudomonadota bacterium]QKK04169.1 MAG: hypothetical protein HND56_00055 [Pseudomonadota bacterium]
MFGGKKDKPRVGATAKRMQAEMIARKHRGEDVKGQKQDVTGPIVLIFLISVAMAFLMTDQGVYDRYAHYFRITGNHLVNQMLVGPGTPVFIGNGLADTIIVSITRGLFLFLLAGSVPYMVRTYARVTDRMQGNLYIMHWGCLIVVPFIIYVSQSFIWPLLKDVYDIFFYTG